MISLCFQLQQEVEKRLSPANYSREILGVINVDSPDSRKLKVVHIIIYWYSVM